jgi:hypothetical protein
MNVTSNPLSVRLMFVGTLKSRWMVSKKNDTSCIASGFRDGMGAMVMDVEAVAIVGLGVDVSGSRRVL